MHYEAQYTPEKIFSELRDIEDVRSARDVRALISLARKERLVKVTVQEFVKSAPGLDRQLAHQLARTFGLRGALVVRTTLASDKLWASDNLNDRERAYRESDALHQQLGMKASEFLLQTLRPGDSIGLGTGRGTGFTVLSLRNLLSGTSPADTTELSTVHVPDLRVFSLSGQIIKRPWSPRGDSGENLDADGNCLELARLLEVSFDRVRLVRLPMFLQSEGKKREDFVGVEAPHLLGSDWKKELGEGRPDIDLAIFGLGVLNPGPHPAMLNPGPYDYLPRQIHDLRLLAEKFPSAFIDVCDRFWLRESQIDHQFIAEAREIVRQLNDHIVTVSFRKLQAARVRLLVAGGDQKYLGISAIVSGEVDVRPTVLVTDEVTAKRLLNDAPHPTIESFESQTQFPLELVDNVAGLV